MDGPIHEGAVKSFIIRICDDCFHLRGEMCHEPGCVFCRRTMIEVGEYLDALLIRPVVDGERLTADEGTEQPVCAEHETPCQAEWICPECLSENPALDEAVAALNEANNEIRDLEARLTDERVR